MRYLRILFVFFFLNALNHVYCQQIINLTPKLIGTQIGESVEICNDSSNIFNANSIISSGTFEKSNKKVPIFLKGFNNIWVRFTITNKTSKSDLSLNIDWANISELLFYKKEGDTLRLLSNTGNTKIFSSRGDENIGFNFRIPTLPDSTGTYYLNIKSIHPVQLPLVINDTVSANKSLMIQTIAMSIYLGILLSILLYNLFLYFSIKDSSYIIYVIYVIVLLFAQLTLSGWSFKIFWPNSPQLNHYAVAITSALPAIAALVFAVVFLHIKSYSRVLYNITLGLIICYCLIPFFCFFIPLNFIYDFLTYGGIAAGLTALVSSGYIARKGFRPAYYYFISWFLFAIGREIFSLRNLGLVPYNTFTTYILYIGSAIEAILLSLALADRINILQKEKNISQAKALSIARENEKLIKEQNVVLEERVVQRTEELQVINHHLIQTLSELKDAQMQLVEAEKMASLGQLTAGIAHEINNPINFVKSNIIPLKLDVKDLFAVIDEYDELHDIASDKMASKLKAISSHKKEIDIDLVKNEIDNLINGIEDGAERTAEIVRGLRTFSRLDESELKVVNLHEGIDSTLVLLRNSMPAYIKVIRKYEAVGDVECYPGKINQVFMNIINNAVQAINSKKEINPEEPIIISTRDVGNNEIEISIKDSGPGMSDEVKQKVFDPFFTTKAVGEGTGLGMAIVFKIVEKHFGKINIITSVNNGAEFILTLPYSHPLS